MTPESRVRPTPSAPEGWPGSLGDAAYYGPLGRLVRAVAPLTEADPAALLLQHLVMFGSIVGRGMYFTAEGARHYAALYAVLVGLSSKSRKGSSYAVAKKGMLLVDPALGNPGRSEKGLSSGEGLLFAVRDSMVGPDGIEIDGVPDKRCLVVESEFASTLKVMARPGNTLSPVLRGAWDGEALGTLTKNNRVTATGSHISLIGHVTRDELRRYLTETEAGNGFGNRILWCCVRRARVLPEGGDLDSVDLDALTAPLRLAATVAAQDRLVVRDDEARAFWNAIYEDLSEGKPGLFGALTGRAEAQVMRLALIYAAADGTFVVGRKHLEAALEVWRYCEESVRYIFGDAVGDPIADEINRALRQSGSLTRTEIRDLLGRNQPAPRVDRALALLVETGAARMTSDASGNGRPVERWFRVGYDINDRSQARYVAERSVDPYDINDINDKRSAKGE